MNPSFSSGHSTTIDRSWNLGFQIRGPFASRSDDSLSVGWTHSRLAPKWRAVQAAAGSNTASAEEALEITYRYAATPYLAISPNYQYVRNPGGSGAPNATLIGLRLELAL